MDPVSALLGQRSSAGKHSSQSKVNTDKTHISSSSWTYYWPYLKDFIHYFKMRVKFKMVKIKVLHSLRSWHIRSSSHRCEKGWKPFLGQRTWLQSRVVTITAVRVTRVSPARCVLTRAANDPSVSQNTINHSVSLLKVESRFEIGLRMQKS